MRGLLLAVLAAIGVGRAADPAAPLGALLLGRLLPTAMAAPADSAEPQGRVVDIVIEGGRKVRGPAIIRVHEGDDVTLRFTDDATDMLHLHGYDLHANLAPGAPSTLHFKADKSGRFTFELHGAGIELGALEVYPR